MSSFLASVRKLFAQEDAESPEAKRRRPDETTATAAAPASSSAPLGSSSPTRHPPGDYSARLSALVSIGWPPRFAAKALETYEWSVPNAAAALQKAHPLPGLAAHGAAAAAAAGTSTANPIEIDEELPPTKFERLPPLPKEAAVPSTITPSTSLGSASSSSSSSSFSSSSSSSSPSIQSTSTSLRSPPASPRLPPATTAVPLTYECVACTFINDIELPRCEVCDTPRHLNQQQSAAMESTVECVICYTHQPPEAMYEPSGAAICRHYLCKDCGHQYLASKLAQGQVLRVCCPACPREYSISEMTAGLDAMELARYERYKRLQELASDPEVIFCPSARCEVALFHTDRPRLVCVDCAKSVCFACKTVWHTGMTCAAFQYAESLKSDQQKLSSLSTAERLFQRFLERNPGHFRQCRACSAWVEKSDGCDKMRCRCGERWCHKCGARDAACHCTPSSHVFFDQQTVLNNWGRTAGRRQQQDQPNHAGPFGLASFMQAFRQQPVPQPQQQPPPQPRTT